MFILFLFFAVMTLAFFGCFRACEFCVADGSSFDSRSHLCFEDVSINEKERSMSVFLRKSQSDVFNVGTDDCVYRMFWRKSLCISAQ
jgi:hypothetical protein